MNSTPGMTSLTWDARLAGLVPVRAVNPINTAMNAVPLRVAGDVRALVLRFAQLEEPGVFHRYVSVTQVGSFVSEDAAERAVPEAERYLRTHPAPGVKFSQPLGKRPERAFVWAFTVIPLGHIETHWDEVSHSIINETRPDHLMSSGFVVRQVARVGRNIFVTTYGEGDNVDTQRAWINGTLGTDGFISMDRRVFLDMKWQAGFMSSPLPRPNGTLSAY